MSEWIRVASVCIFLSLLTIPASQAHIPFIEPEAEEPAPVCLTDEERAELDYSFANPFPLPQDLAFQAMHDFAYDGIDSMAINGYLVPEDVDVFRVVPAPNEGFPFPAILASALPPACRQFVDDYPVVALIGPNLPRDRSVLRLLPFDIDDPSQVPQPPFGPNGVIYAPNPFIFPREIFVEDVVTGLSWFLPAGLTQDCLEPPGNPFEDCETFENSIVATPPPSMGLPGIIPGQPYYVAIWDPAGAAQDYTLNLGITDAHYVDRPAVNAQIECFNLIHGECEQPYPDIPPPPGYFNPLCASDDEDTDDEGSDEDADEGADEGSDEGSDEHPDDICF